MTAPMTHAILGAGGAGGTIGACLAHIGDSVTLIVRSETLALYPRALHFESTLGNFESWRRASHRSLAQWR
jgi:ketopantoate reductase